MKIMHLSDLHLGKRLNEKSLIDDQKFILDEISALVEEHAPDVVIIAGDVYDKSVPSTEAVTLLDSFLERLATLGKQILVLSGNHDSAERLSFGGRLMEASGVHLSPVYSGKIEPIALTDEYGAVNFYMLPFVKPVNVRKYFEDVEIETYTEAVKCIVDSLNLDVNERNVLIAHQFVSGSKRSDSEEVSVGGLDNVDAEVFEPFDYVALGHLHSPQNCGSDKIRYCGTPLKYSFAEADDQKSVTLLELKRKGDYQITAIPLKAQRDLVNLKGTYDQLLFRPFYEGTTYQDDYVHITLTDDQDIPDAVGRLRCVYKNLLKLDYDNERTRTSAVVNAVEVEDKTPIELFSDFYAIQNGQPMTEEMTEYMTKIIDEIWGDEK